MDIIGIICEYNPFHNGHIYHINKIKEMYPDSIIIAVISSSFCQRGEISILNKWDKTKIALDNNIDLVVELPFVYSTQSADIFAKGSLKILNELKVDKLIFGSESNDINNLKEIASVQLNNKDFDKKVKQYLDEGINYPTAVSCALKDLNIKINNTPNDLLGISYIKEIIKNKYNIEPITIKRTNDYHAKDIKGNILNASLIRELINSNKRITKYIPKKEERYIYKNIDYFKLLKYKILSDKENLSTYQTVDEGIENRILKYINEVNDINELVEKIKNKRYTYNKVNRMLIHILASLTKEEAKLDIDYIRVLGMNDKGKKYLGKTSTKLPIITSYKNSNSKLLDIEKRVNEIYSIIINDKSLIKRELEKPVIK